MVEDGINKYHSYCRHTEIYGTNATTGVAPFLLEHGSPSVGYLAILKSRWEDEVVLPKGMGESIANYMQKLRQRLLNAVQYGFIVANNQQKKYVHYHNL